MLSRNFRDMYVESKTAAGFVRPMIQTPAAMRAATSLYKAPTWWDKMVTSHPYLSTAAYMLPGVSTAANIMDMGSNLYRGRIGTAFANLGLAGLSLLPGGTVFGAAKFPKLMGKLKAPFQRGATTTTALAKATPAIPTPTLAPPNPWIRRSVVGGTTALGLPVMYNRLYDSIKYPDIPEPQPDMLDKAFDKLRQAFPRK